MVEAMGGTIGVESAVGVGSRFHFELALAEHAVGAGVDRDLHTGLGALSQTASCEGTILYIEDNLSNISLVEQILSRYPGVRLLKARQGKLGLELANKQTPDWILLDLHLPDMGGEEVLRLATAGSADPRNSGHDSERGCDAQSGQSPEGGGRPRIPHQALGRDRTDRSSGRHDGRQEPNSNPAPACSLLRRSKGKRAQTFAGLRLGVNLSGFP